MELKKRGLTIDGLLSGNDAAALDDAERLVLAHIVEAQPCEIRVLYMQDQGWLPNWSQCRQSLDIKLDGAWP
jgi:hypothetical protein